MLAQSETNQFLRGGTITTAKLHGKAESAKLWIHPKDPAKSFLITVQGNWVAIFDLGGHEVFEVEESTASSTIMDEVEVPTILWYLDIIYSFPFPIGPDRLVDLVILANARKTVLSF